MYLLVFFFVFVRAYDYDWNRLHACRTATQLKDTVADYHENFPCLDCRDHFQSLLAQHPFPLDRVQTPKDVLVWTWFTHNLVNLRLNKTWESFDIMDECSVDSL